MALLWGPGRPQGSTGTLSGVEMDPGRPHGVEMELEPEPEPELYTLSSWA